MADNNKRFRVVVVAAMSTAALLLWNGKVFAAGILGASPVRHSKQLDHILETHIGFGFHVDTEQIAVRSSQHVLTTEGLYNVVDEGLVDGQVTPWVDVDMYSTVLDMLNTDGEFSDQGSDSLAAQFSKNPTANAILGIETSEGAPTDKHRELAKVFLDQAAAVETHVLGGTASAEEISTGDGQIRNLLKGEHQQLKAHAEQVGWKGTIGQFKRALHQQQHQALQQQRAARQAAQYHPAGHHVIIVHH